MSATLLQGVIRNGQVEVAEPIDLPDGTVVQLLPVIEPMPANDDGTMSPQEIARILSAMEKIEPFEMTPEEEAAWEANRQARKEWDKAHFNERADKLRGQ